MNVEAGDGGIGIKKMRKTIQNKMDTSRALFTVLLTKGADFVGFELHIARSLCNRWMLVTSRRYRPLKVKSACHLLQSTFFWYNQARSCGSPFRSYNPVLEVRQYPPRLGSSTAFPRSIWISHRQDLSPIRKSKYLLKCLWQCFQTSCSFKI